MTVTSTTAISGPYDGNDATVTFDYTFVITDESELKVTLTDEDGVDTVQTLTTHYSVTIGDDGTGTFTMVTAPATGEQVTATMQVSGTQETDLLNYGAFNAEVIEDALDKLTRLHLQLSERVDRCIKLGQSNESDPSDVTVANLAEQVTLDTSNLTQALSTCDGTLQDAIELADGIGYGARLLDSVQASADASISVTSASCSSYSELRLEFIGIKPVTDDVGLYVRVSDDLGSSFYNGATDYGWNVAVDDGNSHGNVVYDISDNQLYVVPAGYTCGNQTYEVVRGSLRIIGHNGETNTDFPRFSGFVTYYSPNTQQRYARVVGSIWQLKDLDGFQIAFSSGNIASGTMKLWGMLAA